MNKYLPAALYPTR